MTSALPREQLGAVSVGSGEAWLSDRLLTSLSDAVLDGTLAHELAHVAVHPDTTEAAADAQASRWGFARPE